MSQVEQIQNQMVQIESKGLKSRDRVIHLSGRDAFLGGAYSGKSTIRYAVMFLATGQNPEVGKTHRDAGLLMRGNEMSVRVEWADGSFASRTLRRKGAGFTESAECSWLPVGAGVTETTEAIRGRFGATDKEAVENVDLQFFASMTGPDQTKVIDGLLDQSGMENEEIHQRLGVMAALRIQHGGDVDAPEDRSLWPQVRAVEAAQMSPALKAQFDAYYPRAWTWIEIDGLAGAIDRAKECKREAQDGARRKVAARAEIESRIFAVEGPAETLDDLNKERQGLSDQLAVLRSDLDSHKTRSAARTQAEAALESARLVAEGLANDGDPEAQVAELRQRAQDMRAEAARLVDPSPVPAWTPVEQDAAVIEQAAALDSEAANLRAGAKAATPAQDPHEQRLPIPGTGAEKAALDRIDADIKKALEDDWSRVRLMANCIDEDSAIVGVDDEGEPEYPHAGRTDVLRELADKNGVDIEALRARGAAAETALRAAERASEEAQEANEKIDERNAARVEAAAESGKKAEDLRAQAQAKTEEASALRRADQARITEANAVLESEYREKFRKRAIEADGISQKRKAHNRQADQAEAEANDLARRWSAAQSALREAQAHLDGMDSVAPLDIDAHEVEIFTAEQAIAKLDETKRAVEGSDARKRELDEITEAIVTAEAEFKVASAMAWALPKLRDLDLSERRGPILSRMRVFLEGAGMSDRPYLRAEKGKAVYGLATGADHPDLEAGTERHGLALSGAEGVLFRAAFWAAIVGLRAPHTRVLALEIDDLDEKTAKAFFAGVAALDLPNCLVFTNRKITPPSGWAWQLMDQETREVVAA